MKASAIAALLAGCILVFSIPAAAQNEVFTMYADSTMDGHNGTLLRITAPGESTTGFLYDDGGMVRAYAFRDDLVGIWFIFPAAEFICPTTTMNINDSWRSLDDPGATTSTVVAFESVTVPAGTFPCYRVEVVRDSDPSTVIQNVWYSDGVGLVKQVDTFPYWESVLFSYQIMSGSGYLPMGPGNIWNYQDVTSPVESRTWGGVKALYQ